MKACWLPTEPLSLLPTLGLGVQVAAFRYQRPSLASDSLPTENRQNFSADVARVGVGRQEHVGGRELLRLGWALHRDVLAEFLDVVRVARLDVERSPDRTGRNRVHPNPFLDEVLRQRLREGVDRSLRRRVVEESLLALESGDRAGVDDA